MVISRLYIVTFHIYNNKKKYVTKRK